MTEVYVIDDANVAFEELNKIVGQQNARGITNSEEQQLLRSIKSKTALLGINPTYGDKVPRKFWPKELAEKYKLTNLWRVGLSNYWRMLYLLRGDKVEVVCFVIKIIDHHDYNRLFGYRKK